MLDEVDQLLALGFERQIAEIVELLRARHAAAAAAGDAIPALADETERLLHKTMRKVTTDIEKLGFNTAISALMVLANELAGKGANPPVAPRDALERLVLMVAPFAPHLGEECWRLLGHEQSLAYAPWVEWDDALCEDSVVTLGVQVNGKVRAQITLAPDAAEDDARALALADPNVAKFVDGKELKKFVYVPGRIVNVVVGK